MYWVNTIRMAILRFTMLWSEWCPAGAREPLEQALDIREAAFPDREGYAPHPRRVTTADWLATCLFAVDPPEAAAAEELCARYGLDPEERRAGARAIMGRGE